MSHLGFTIARTAGNGFSRGAINTMWPSYWADAPGHLSHFPVVGGITVIDPWDYMERLAMYKILLAETRSVLAPYGRSNTGNVMWGLPKQLGWQFRTGRLGHFGGEPGNPAASQPYSISATSWWGVMNYYLAVIPFMGAIRAGYFSHWPRPIHLRAPSDTVPGVPSYPKTVEECLTTAKSSTEGWARFFQYLKDDRDDDSAPTTFSTKYSDDVSPLDDAMLQVMWEAHLATAILAADRVRPLLCRMSQPEASFGLSWILAVDFLAATHWPTDLPTTHKNQVIEKQNSTISWNVLSLFYN